MAGAVEVLIVLLALGVVLLLVREQTRALGIKVAGGLALVVLLFSSIFFVQTRYQEQPLRQDQTQAQGAGERAVYEHAEHDQPWPPGHFLHDRPGTHEDAERSMTRTERLGVALARPKTSMDAGFIFIIVALGTGVLLAREKTRSVGIKIVGGVALFAVLLVGGYFWTSVPSVENLDEWNRRQSHWAPGHDAHDQVAEHHSAGVLETPPIKALPENVTIAQQPPVIGEGRPPEPMPEIIAEREPAAAAGPVATESHETQPAAGAGTPTATDQRPAWVDLPPRLEGDVYIVVANSGPFVTERECTEALYGEAQKVARRVIDDLIGPGTADVVQSDEEYVRRLIDRVCKQQYDETRSTSVGPMKIMHVRMEFDDQTRADLKQRWRQAQLEGRLRQVARGAVWVLALVGAVYFYLKVDTATKGYYTKRLQVMAVVVILTIIVIGLSVA